MSAIVTAVVKGTLGFLVKKGQQHVAKKLKDGDVTDQQLRNWIVNEIDDVKSKLDAMAMSHLKASLSFFKEGLVYLNKVMDMETSGDSKTTAASAAVEKVTKTNAQITEVTKVGANAALSLTEELRKLNLNDLNESGKEALLDAKKRFDDARREATLAFNTEVLSPSDRILAMVVRLMATIMEKVENPVSAVAACRSGLEELHLMPFVRENFSVELTKGIKSKFSREERSQIISSVCQINRIIYDVTLMVGDKEGLFIWPCVQIGDEKVDPLRDSRVVNTLCKLEMGGCSLAWSFGQEGKEEQQRLKSARSITTNTLGQFLVVDNRDQRVKVFDTSGTFLHSFGLCTEDEYISRRSLDAVASDKDDNIYVLVNGLSRRNRAAMARMYMFNQSPDQFAQLRSDFTVGTMFYAATVKVTDSRLLVPGRYSPGRVTPSDTLMSQSDQNYVVVCNRKGKHMDYFSKEPLGPIRDITAADDRIMVLNKDSNVYVFSNTFGASDASDLFWSRVSLRSLVLRYVNKFSVAADAHAITFHATSGHVIIASKTQDRSQLLFYSKEGSFQRSIELELEKTDQITSAAETTNGRICITVTNYDQGKGKVLVL